MDTAQYITLHYIRTVSEAHLQNWSANVLAFESISVVIMEAVRNLKERDTEENRIERLAHGDLFIQYITSRQFMSCNTISVCAGKNPDHVLLQVNTVLHCAVHNTIQYNTIQHNTTQHQH